MPTQSNRRTFLRDSLLVSPGVVAGTFLPELLRSVASATQKNANADDRKLSPTPEQRLKQLGIKLPPASKPVAVYRPAVVSGNMLYTSGHGPTNSDGEFVRGKVGAELNIEQGYAAARATGLSILSTVRETLGSLDKVARLVKVLGMVNCTADFNRQPQVINGFSELMVQVFGETNGKAARSAVGMASLPFDIPVEIEAIFEIRS